MSFGSWRGASIALWVACALLFASAALAQGTPAPAPPTGGTPGPAAPVITPPRVKKFVEATYPEAAQAQGLEARVELEVVIGADGLVKDAKVVAPVGNGFDEAALTAVRQFEFEPATKDGQPIAARIRYPYIFELQVQEPPPPEPEAPPPPARFEGTIRDAEDDKPLEAAEVSVSGATLPEPLMVQTDAEGRFTFEALPPGEYTVTVQSRGLLPREQKEELVSGEITTVTYRLQEPVDEEAFTATARIAPPPREVTRRSIGKQQLTRIPGTRGDALRTVELMPGVARPPLGSGQLIVRGSSPFDSTQLFEGVPVPLLYHFGGLTSVVNSRLLEEILFYPSNFSVRYGRFRGGVVEVKFADIPSDRFHGVAEVNLLDSSLLVTTPLGSDAELALAGRRSHFDVLFGSALESADLSTIAAPVYYDYQAIATYRPGPDDDLKLMVYGSHDEFALLFEEPVDTDAAISGDFDFGTSFNRGQLSWHRDFGKDLDQDLSVAVGSVDFGFGVGEELTFNLSGADIYARSEWNGRVSDRVRLIGGLDVFVLPGEYTYRGPPPGSSESNPNSNASGASLSNLDRIEAVDQFTAVQPAVYLESSLNLDPLGIVLGTRVDYFDAIDEFAFDPRLSAHYIVSEAVKLKGGIGWFTQPPQFQESDPFLGNPDLDPQETLHVSTGADYEPSEGLTFGIDLFYKHLYGRVIGTPTGEPPRFINDGEGRVAGMELLAKVDPQGRFFGYLSYTLSRSERKDGDGDWLLFEFDQTHILNIAGVWRLGRGWEFGALFRLVSGNLDTPVIGASENLNTGLYSPIYGPVNSVRNPTFHRLDLRIEKQWAFSAWKLAVYLDLQNAYNRLNPEGRTYDFEYREFEDIQGLPIIPNLGVRGEI